MQAEIISIGDELTSGQRLDTNSQWLAERLGELGVKVIYHTTVADDMTANIRVLREALARVDIVITSGGLGPTADDLTRQALAETVGVPLVHEPVAWEHIQALFAKRNRPIPPANAVQALFPQGSKIIPNPHGTAPGIDLAVSINADQTTRIFCLPGVPAEMKEMWEQSVAPTILTMQPAPRIIRHSLIKCFGVGESDLEAMLPDMIRRGRDPVVGITVSKATISLRITASGANEAECQAKIAPTFQEIHACLGDLVYGYEQEELQHAVLRLLNKTHLSLATLECGTGGLVAQALSAASANSAHYRGGEIMHPASTNATHGNDVIPLTKEMLLQLTRQVREKFQADCALAIGAIPGQSWYVSPDATIPAVWLAVVSADNATILHTPYTGHPDILQPRLAKNALNLLRKWLLKSENATT
jgi:nicotinamide-nucleotide amidase